MSKRICTWRGMARLARLCQGHDALKQHLAEHRRGAITKAAAATFDRLTDELDETD